MFVRVFFALLLTVCVFSHLGFRFGSKPEELLVDVFWVTAQNQEAFESFHEQVQSSPSGNFIFSPLLDSRRRGLTQPEAVFKAPAYPEDEQLLALNTLKESLIRNREHQMDIKCQEVLAVSEQASKDIREKAKENSKRYAVDLKSVSFENENSILKWFQKKFNYKIDSLILAPRTESAVLSGLSLRGLWRDGFEVSNTREKEFFPAEGEPYPVAMMMKAGYQGYFEDDDFQAVDLRYGDGKVSLLVFLPKPESDLGLFYTGLNLEHWTEWMKSFNEREGHVHLPRFKVKSFSKSCCQLASLEVDEKGGKVSFQYDMTEVLGQEALYEITINRPFFFVVHDNQTGLILQMGQITNPDPVKPQSD